MTKVMQRKPGPKSVKQSKIFDKRGTLGESSAESSEEDDSSPEYTLDNNSKQASATPESRIIRSRVEAGNASEFRTPDTENDVTDYGLEFTTSHIQNPSPRRCSTLRSAPSSQEEVQSIDRNKKTANKENETPRSTLADKTPTPQKTKPAKKAISKQTKLKSTPKPKEVLSSTKETPDDRTEEAQQQVVRKPRKRRNPIQLEKRFWKDVQNLQNRTDHLIPMLPFSRLVRELMHDASTEVSKITPTALEALQTSSELYITQRLQDAYMLTLHRGRVTLDVKDMELINYLKINL